MGSRAGLDGRIISPPPGFDPRTVQPVAQSLYRLSYPAAVVYMVQANGCVGMYRLCSRKANLIENTAWEREWA